MDWLEVGRDLQRSSCPNPLLNQGHLEQVAHYLHCNYVNIQIGVDMLYCNHCTKKKPKNTAKNISQSHSTEVIKAKQRKEKTQKQRERPKYHPTQKSHLLTSNWV